MESTFSLELSILCSTDADSLPNFTTVADTPSDARDSVELDVVVLIIPIENVREKRVTMEEKEVKTPSDDLNREHNKASSAHDEQQDDLIIEVDLFKSLDDCNVVDR
ncbi:hypothetical protein V8G54_003752 [Vigna mungo]|uniref:Uncharacterized protein n=1 Tax=Vigna mungo TaxID=3915 RepID=A0AAQ3PEJ6_VIGMU